VRALGEVAIAHDGIALPLPETLCAVALLRWLAVHAGSRTRSEIALSLWPNGHDVASRRVDVVVRAPPAPRDATHRVAVDQLGEPVDGGTKMSVHVEVPVSEAARLDMQRDVIASALRKLGTLAAASAV
jgi:hypothetical protein